MRGFDGEDGRWRPAKRLMSLLELKDSIFFQVPEQYRRALDVKLEVGLL